LLLTQQDLADRWQVGYKTIGKWIRDGIIQPVKDLPVIRFTEQHIQELEGVKLDKMSPLERRRLEGDIERLKAENEKLRNVVSKVLAEVLKTVNTNMSIE
jgi:predicted site-specific integrase-resolvase